MSNTITENQTGTAGENVKTVAVIDIGSTSIRMAIAEILASGEVRRLETVSQGVTLGKDTFTTGAIKPETTELIQAPCGGLPVAEGYGSADNRTRLDDAVQLDRNPATGKSARFSAARNVSCAPARGRATAGRCACARRLRREMGSPQRSGSEIVVYRKKERRDCCAWLCRRA